MVLKLPFRPIKAGCTGKVHPAFILFRFHYQIYLIAGDYEALSNSFFFSGVFLINCILVEIPWQIPGKYFFLQWIKEDFKNRHRILSGTKWGNVVQKGITVGCRDVSWRAPSYH